ncbi:MAG: calcium/sodium antiporter [Natronospirillum sp.]|uniref:calcium/sodium antiporter n=1 Tax=Natronospirillum sp. TaxID=2812955 RepID=UPI0025FB215E|nr:calcium/sodium antiporter [Natronospirillum sp.]MCH8552255.1 calcium/sodium antiporter [Natronospirillum sp.]
MTFLLPIMAFISGLALLIWSADRFVHAAAATALRLGISPLLIGLTVVALGTSAPEVLVSASAAWQGSTAMALGNAQGSNVANIALILGLVLLLAPVPVPPGLAGRQALASLAAIGLLGYTLHDLTLTRLDSALLLLGLVAYLVLTLHQAQRDRRLASAAASAANTEAVQPGPLRKEVLLLLATLLLLLLGARLLVWGASTAARELGISELVIGATIVALGTSLPELATAISSTLRRHHDMTLGNLLGSNVFNIFAVIGTAGMIGPDVLESAIWRRDFLFLALSGLMLVGLIWLYRLQKKNIHRLWALPLLGLYATYILLNYRALII